MSQAAQTPDLVCFGVFELDLRSGELRKQGHKIRIEGQPVQILMMLLERPGELVTREEIKNRLWSADTYVSFEHGINAAVKRLRGALNDSAANPRFIETLARRGYRFLMPVTHAGAGAAKRAYPIAVLPFENTGGDPEAEYLSDGVTESLINTLSRLPDVRVVARSTVFRYKDKDADPRVVGRELNVRAVLIGRIQQRGEALVIGAELVEVEHGWQLWGDNYKPPLSDLIAVEENIARAISEKLLPRLNGEDKRLLGKRPTQNPTAYQYYLRGRYCCDKMTDEWMRKGIAYFGQAIQTDPGYALAYAGLADAYCLIAFFNLVPPLDVMPKAKAAAQRAVEIDDSLPEAHASLGCMLEAYDLDWEGAGREFRRALELNPNHALARRFYADYLIAVARTSEAATEIQKAQEIDPLSPVISNDAAWNSCIARQYERSVEQCFRTLDLEPYFAPAHLILGSAYLGMGRFEEALGAIEKARSLSGGSPSSLAALGRALAAAGRRAQAIEVLDQLVERSRRTYVSSYWEAIVQAALGEVDRALDCLEKCYASRDVWIIFLKVEPSLDPLRAHARFEDLMRRVGFPKS